MAQKRIEIIYDVNGKAIDVAVQSTLNLQQQVKALTAELRRTKEGSDEFKVLSTRLGDAQDQLAKTNAKSKDLFSSLSMLPGPVGQFFGQLQGTIELLKTFTSFSTKDLNFQLKETAGDLKDISDNVLGAKDGVDKLGEANKNLSEKSREADGSLKSQAETTTVATTKLKTARDVMDEYIKVNGRAAAAGMEFDQTTGKMVSRMENIKTAGGDANKVIETTTKTFGAATIAGRMLGSTMTLVGISFETAAIAVGIFEAALAALGIGLIIAAIVALFEIIKNVTVSFYDWATGITAANKELEDINKTIAKTNELLDLDQKSMKRRQAEYIAAMKAKGATDKQIRDQQVKDLKDQLTLVKNSDKVLAEQEAKMMQNKQTDLEELKKLQKRRMDLDQQALDISSQIRVAEFNDISENNKKVAEERRKDNENAQKLLEKRNQDKKTADEAYRQLLQENSVLSLKTERERQLKELENQAENEKLKINALDISTKRKEEIVLQITTKYAAKTAELKNKFSEEDLKKEKEFNEKIAEAKKKLGEIEIAAIENQTAKEKQERENKYDEDLRDLKKSFDDKLISLEEYQMAVINLNQALVNDLKKIDEDAKKRENDALLKKLDDDIRFQEIANEANKNSFVAYWKGRETLLDKAKQRELAQLDLTEAQKLAIEKKYVQLSKDLQREKYEAYVGYLNQGLGAVQSVLSQELAIRNIRQQDESDALQLKLREEQKSLAITSKSKEEYNEKNAKIEEAYAIEQDKIKEKYFYRNKDAQYAQALIAASQAAISAYASLAVIPVVGPALGIAAAAVALGYGIKQANLIKAQKYVSTAPIPVADSGSSAGSNNIGKNYEEGGLINGPRHAQGGVMIEAEGGEAVMTRGAVTMFAPLLSAMNQMGGGTSFTRGAAGQAGFDAPKVTETITQPQIVKTYVVSSELTTEAQKQARLKDLSTL
jgi:hypothetical protein